MNKKFFVVLCVLINAIYMNAKAENFDYKVISEEKEIKIIADEKYETAPRETIISMIQKNCLMKR